MSRLLDEWLHSPLTASSNGLYTNAVPGNPATSIESAVARFAHDMTTAGTPETSGSWYDRSMNGRVADVPPDLEPDARVLPTVEEYLARGLDLKRWWDEVERLGGPPNRFPLDRSFNRPNRSYGFFGEAPVRGRMMPVMGNVQEMFYDQSRAPEEFQTESVEWTHAQLQEFVLKYFMRISAFRQPETFVDSKQPLPPPVLEPLSWCPRENPERVGFGFSQLFYKPVGSELIYPFISYDRHSIVDQRDVGRLYEWLLLKVRIFDFNVSARPFGERGPELVFGLNEESYLVVNEGLVRNHERPLPGVLADYGIGYSFVRSPEQGLFGYGPGDFEAAIELINFRIYETGYISVRMVFVANRPEKVTNIVVDPVDWSFRVADAFSFGVASRVLWPARGAFGALPLRFTVDPVTGYVNLANSISNGAAARDLCISREQLEKLFLVQHFRQHYQTVLGSLLTWRMIPDWRDEKNLPSWIVSGLSE